MNRLTKTIILLVLIFSSGYAQEYDLTIFKENHAQFKISTFGAWQPTDSSFLTVNLIKTDSCYSFQIKQITSNNILLYSDSVLNKVILSFQISSRDKIKIIETDNIKNVRSILKENLKKKYKLSEDDNSKMNGYEALLFNPAVMYEGYFEPYIEIFKHFIDKKIKSENKEIFVNNFNDSIPSILNIECSKISDSILIKHSLIQDKIKISNYLYDIKAAYYKERGKDVKYRMGHYKRDNMNFMKTNYSFNSISTRNQSKYLLQKIEYESSSFRGVTKIRIERM